MKTFIATALLLAFALLTLAACSNRAAEANSDENTSAYSSEASETSQPEIVASEPAQMSSSAPSSSAPESSVAPSELTEPASSQSEAPEPVPVEPEPAGIYSSVLEEYGLDEFTTESWGEYPPENMALLEQWIENYRLGIPGKVAVMLHGPPLPVMFVFEYDGDNSYTISEYGHPFADDPVQKAVLRNVHESSVIVERAFDYGFGTDLPEEVDKRPVYIQRAPLYPTGEMNFTTDLPLEGITLQEIEDRAFGDIKAYFSSLGATQPYFKTVGTMEISGILFFIVYGNSDEEALNRGEHGGRVAAVSTDLKLVLDQSMVDGTWFFSNDAEQKVITPNLT